MELRKADLKGPYPSLRVAEISTLPDEITFHRVGRRSIGNVFVLIRKGFATLYVKKKYTAYRSAYKSVFQDCLLGRDVDHLIPRSTLDNDHFVALGHIDSRNNRSHNANTNAGIIAVKALNYQANHLDLLTNTPRVRELGLFVINGYIKPLDEVNIEVLTEIGRNNFLIENMLNK